MSEFTAADRDRVFAMGERISMRVDCVKQARELPSWPWERPKFREVEEIDKEALRDPARSDMPLMVAMVRAGYYHAPEWDMRADHEIYTWRITEQGRAVRAAAAVVPAAAGDGDAAGRDDMGGEG